VSIAMLAVLVILGPNDSVLAAGGRPSVLPASNHAMLHGQALAWAKAEAQALFPRRAQEVWATVCAPGDGRPADADLHVLIACAPNDAALPWWALTALPEVVAARQAADPWLRAAADAVAAVRQMAALPSDPHAQPPHDEDSPSMPQLWRDGCTANLLLRDHLNVAVWQPGNPNLFKEWAMRIPVVGMAPDVSSTSCTGRFDLQDSIARLQFLFHAKRLDLQATVAAPPIPEQILDYQPKSVRDILMQEAPVRSTTDSGEGSTTSLRT
jgi:hypothetical protein